MALNKKSDGVRHWSRDAVAYQIYPMSFSDSNGDGKGDLAGILKKLDYLNGKEDSLGIDAVWICPFYRSPMRDFGYDIEDFMDIDPTFGNLADFDKLVKGLKKRNIKLIIDFVGNHTSDRHKWFQESKSSKNNPKRDWYVWRDGQPNNQPPNNWISVFGGSAWEYDPATKQYYLHSFLKEQPDLNWRNPEVRKAMSEIIDFWVERGADGLRIDAFLHFLEDKFLREDPANPLFNADSDNSYNALIHTHSIEDFSRMDVISNFVKETLDRHKDLLIVSEAYLDPAGIRKIQNICPSDRFTIFNFNFINRKWDALEYKRVIDDYLNDLPENFLPNFVFGNHDVDRLVSRVGEAEARIAAFIQFTLPGLPFVYYGEEIGMENTKIPHDALMDVVAKIFKGYHGGRDPERTPMQWSDKPHAGFSTHKPWLPVNDNYKSVNVEKLSKDPSSMLSHYKKLISFRRQNDVLRYGSYVPVDSHSENVFSFERVLGNERFLVMANFGANIERELLSGSQSGAKLIYTTSTSRPARTDSLIGIELLPFEGYILKL